MVRVVRPRGAVRASAFALAMAAHGCFADVSIAHAGTVFDCEGASIEGQAQCKPPLVDAGGPYCPPGYEGRLKHGVLAFCMPLREICAPDERLRRNHAGWRRSTDPVNNRFVDGNFRNPAEACTRVTLTTVNGRPYQATLYLGGMVDANTYKCMSSYEPREDANGVLSPPTEDQWTERAVLYSPEDIKCFTRAPFAASKSCTGCGDTPRHLAAPVGDPIYPLTGAMAQVVRTGFTLGRSELTLTYDTTRALDASPRRIARSFGTLWFSSLHQSLGVGTGMKALAAFRGNGTVATFVLDNGAYVPDADVNDRIVADGNGYRYTDATKQRVEIYDSQGRLTESRGAHGSVLTFSYTQTGDFPDAGYLKQVSDGDGRFVRFEYILPEGTPPALSAVAGLVSRVVNAQGQGIDASYDAKANLARLTWPDGKTVQFLYENPALPWAMTGRIDENGDRDAGWTYDAQGRAIATTRPHGAQAYAVSWSTPPTVSYSDVEDDIRKVLYERYGVNPPTGLSVTGPDGRAQDWAATYVVGLPMLTGSSQSAGSGSEAATSAKAYDTGTGNLLWSEDFKDARTCYFHDAANREVTRFEGLPKGQACPAESAAAPEGARKIRTEWHPDWRLPTRVIEPLMSTTKVYQGRPDPQGGPVANCVAGGAALAVVCKQVRQATLADGSNDPAQAALVSTYTYDAGGRLLTSVEPETATTTYAYYESTQFSGAQPDATGYTAGDLQSVTDDRGRITRFSRYDRSGRVIEAIDAKGVVTTMAYTPRGWIESVTVGVDAAARVTRYGYDSVGQRTRVDLPDGTSLGYQYDAAHRLVGHTDRRGNSVAYVLDAMGNRTGEELRDPGGTVMRSTPRTFDALNRTQHEEVK